MNKTAIAKLIIVQPLADHDGAAIFAIEIITFEKQTGVLLNRVTIFPDLEEQIEEERSIDMNTLTCILRGESTQGYLNKQPISNIAPGLQSIIPLLTQELFTSTLECDLFWWNAMKSYPVLRAFYVQHNEDVDTNFELETVIDVRSFIGTKRISKLDDNDQVYSVLNRIAQRFMPPEKDVGFSPEAKANLEQFNKEHSDDSN